MGLLQGDSAECDGEAVCEYFGEGTIHAIVSIRKGNYKYVYVHENSELLFDIEKDPNRFRLRCFQITLKVVRIHEEIAGIISC